MNLILKSTADPAEKVVVHHCLFCGQRILLQKGRQRAPIPFDENTLQHHECLYIDCARRSQLKKGDFTNHNHYNNLKEEHPARQSTLLEFTQGFGANTKSSHKNCSSATRIFNTEPTVDGGLA